MSKHVVTIIRSADGSEAEYDFDLVSTARNFAREVATEAKQAGSDVSMTVRLKDGSFYCWTQSHGWEDLSVIASL